jgi:Xaa-Pro dipeptidase
VLEFGGVYQRYTAPVYATAVLGPPPERLRRLADACLTALDRLYAHMRPGQPVRVAAQAARQALREVGTDVEINERHGYSVGLGFPPDWVEHSVVLTDESEDVLESGMVFHTPRTVRIPGLMAAGFSETIVVTDGGYEVLTPHKRELVVI